MKLTVRKNLEYFSPTSIMQAMGCELEFYLLRLAGYENIRLPQNRQMAVGCAFDSFVKSEISQELDKGVLLSTLLETVEEQNLDCIPIGHKVFDFYEQYGIVKKLIDEGVHDIELEFKKTIGGKQIPGTEKTIGGVNLFGKPDAATNKVKPHDWKTSGFESGNTKSPKPGYCYLNRFGIVEPAHEDKNRPMEEVDKNWATQLTIYSWLLDGFKIEDIPGSIDQIIIPPNLDEGVIVAQYRNIISKSFVQDLWAKIQDLWDRFKEGIIEVPVCSIFLCEPFNSPKPCTVVCPVYQRWMADPIAQMIARKK